MTTSDQMAAMPHDIAAEQAVLGGMMLSDPVLGECLDILTPGSFFRAGHQMVFAAIAAIADAGQPVDAVTVKAELERRRELGKMGGAPYLHTLLAACPAAVTAPHYARRLLELQARRDFGEAGPRITQLAASPDITRTELIDRAYQALDEASGVAEVTGSVTAADLIVPMLDSLEAGPDEAMGIPTGWRDLDEVIPGFRPGEVTIIGARPSTGKSVILLNIGAYAALCLGKQILAVTLEMSRSEYMERLLSAEAGVDLTRIRERQLDDADWAKIRKAEPVIRDARELAMHDGPALSVAGIRAELRAMRRAGRPAELLTVDYLTLVESAKRSENRQVEVSEISRKLKLLAKEFGIPVLAAAALNRGPEMRSDHRPLMADLRDSGSLEQDSDIVILLYREDQYEPESPRAGEIDLIVAKNRQGPKTTVTLAFQGHYARCKAMYRQTWTPTSIDGAA